MPRLENWSKMKDRSKVVPTPGPPEVGCIVGGDVYGSARHSDGTTITTGEVLEVFPDKVVTRSHGESEIYVLGKSIWQNPDIDRMYRTSTHIREALG